MIEFKNITKEYGSVKALDKVDFTIKKGEFVFIVGPSGAGKSTIVKLLMRKEFPTKGEVIYEDIPVAKLKDRYLPLLRQEIGVVFQDSKLINTKTVYENVAFGLEVLRFSEKEILEKVKEVLELVGLWDVRDHFPQQLSGGEMQRVAIARSIASTPKVFVADEPTGNIDPALTDSLFKIFDKINKKGITVLVATHDKDEVNKMKKRVIALDKGKLVRDEKKGKYATS